MNARDNFLIARQGGIGGSDIGAILGVSPFKTPVDVYLAKTDPTPKEEQSELFYWGHALEAPIAARFAQEHGVQIIRPEQIARHPEHEWMVANLDGIIPGQPNGVLEIKTVSAFGGRDWGVEGSDEVPLAYVAQVAWYMAVMDYPYAKIAALFGGNEYREFHIDRDRELEDILIEKGREFWFNHVQANSAPEATTPGDVQRLFKRDNGSAIVADEALFEIIEDIKASKSMAKRLESEIELLETKIKARMGEASSLVYHGQTLATWKTQSARRFDTKAFEAAHPALCEQFRKVAESRVFRLKQERNPA